MEKEKMVQEVMAEKANKGKDPGAGIIRTTDCETCSHKDVCKYKEIYAMESNGIKKCIDLEHNVYVDPVNRYFFESQLEVSVKCKLYENKYEHRTVTSLGGDGGTVGAINWKDYSTAPFTPYPSPSQPYYGGDDSDGGTGVPKKHVNPYEITCEF